VLAPALALVGRSDRAGPDAAVSDAAGSDIAGCTAALRPLLGALVFR
jgi:hypothetical protein